MFDFTQLEYLFYKDFFLKLIISYHKFTFYFAFHH